MTHAALYIRVSTDLQARDDRHGLERQEAEARAYAARQGLMVGEVYSDTITGRSETRRGLEALKTAAPRYRAVITSEADRLGRTPLAGHKIMAELMAAGFQVHNAVDGLYNPDDDTSALTFDFRMLIAHSELRSIKRRMLGGKLARAEKGGVIPHGWRCYGYRQVWQTGSEGRPIRSIEVDEAEAAVVREVFHRLAGGEGTTTVADDLNRRDIPTAMGKNWVAHRIWYMVKNRAYLGEVTMQLRHADREFTFAVPPLVELATWEAAQGSVKRKPKLHPEVFPLNGLLHCAVCGGAMSGTNKVTPQRAYSHYRCTRAWKHAHYGAARCDHTTHYRAADLHEAAAAAVLHLAENPEAYLDQVTQAAPDTGRQRAAKEVVRLEGLLARYRADYSRNLLDGDEYAQLRDEARAQLAAAQAEAAVVPMPVLRDPRESLDRVGALVGEGLSWREVLHRSGTSLHLAPGGKLEVRLRV